jgi:hypothetical protein
MLSYRGETPNILLPSIEIFSCNGSTEFMETQYHEYNELSCVNMSALGDPFKYKL